MSAINQVGRWLGALAVTCLLAVDGCEQEGTLNKPTNIDPTAWALYNQSQDRTLAELSGLPTPEVKTDITHPISDLLTSVRRAASELEGTSEKGDRVAVQLLTALARFSAETGMP